MHQSLHQEKLVNRWKQDFLILTQLKLPVMITDNKGLVTWMNSEYESLCGYTLSELSGKKPGDYLHGPFTNLDIKDRISQAIKEQRPIDEDILNYNKRQKKYWVSLNISPMYDENGTVNFFVCVAKDITEQRELERESVKVLAKAAKMMVPEGWIKKCAWSGKVLDKKGKYISIEEYFARYSETRFSHGISPDSAKKVLNDKP